MRTQLHGAQQRTFDAIFQHPIANGQMQNREDGSSVRQLALLRCLLDRTGRMLWC